MKRSGERIPELDGFRVCLVFLVSWFHFWQQSWLTPYIGRVSLDFLVRAGYMFVDGTILLSGFLLTLPYAVAITEGRPLPETRAFYRRRIQRIVPSFWLVTLLMLFIVVLPYHLYTSASGLGYDLLMHALMIFTWDRTTYLGSQLGGSSWTIALEMQFYWIFPLLMQGVRRKPGLTMAGMALIAAYFRGWCVWAMQDYGMVVNQLPAFLDVYALGMACAFLYLRIQQYNNRQPGRRWLPAIASLTFLLGCWALVGILKAQAGSPDFAAIQSGQMIRRPLLALVFAVIMLSLPFCVRPIRFFFGNPVMHFLSMISMNYYLVHQNVSVHLKRLGIPASEYPLPNQSGDTVWKYRYTFLCLGISLALAAGITFLVEKPCGRLISKGWERLDRRRNRARNQSEPMR